MIFAANVSRMSGVLYFSRLKSLVASWRCTCSPDFVLTGWQTWALGMRRIDLVRTFQEVEDLAPFYQTGLKFRAEKQKATCHTASWWNSSHLLLNEEWFSWATRGSRCQGLLSQSEGPEWSRFGLWRKNNSKTRWRKSSFTYLNSVIGWAVFISDDDLSQRWWSAVLESNRAVEVDTTHRFDSIRGQRDILLSGWTISHVVCSPQAHWEADKGKIC